MGLNQVEFRYGFAEELPVDEGWADVVISNGVINLCADKRAAFDEIFPASCVLAVCCSSRTSRMVVRCHLRRSATWTYQQVELPEGCPVRAGS